MISVLLTAYCGEKYIGEQVASILPQLQPGDELLISDDSPDNATHDAIFKVVDCLDDSFFDENICITYSAFNENPGVIGNVEHLLERARGDIIVLCDQDDVWLPGKLDHVRDLQGCALFVHAAHTTDECLNITGKVCAKPGLLRNIMRNTYTGCCMAFTRELLPRVLPFPNNIPMHDQWIALQAEKHGRVTVQDEPLILWRRHAGTQTGQHTTLRQKITWRIALIKALKGGCR
jgi:glycosyltransferase involved in cell wall biosynthesis